MFEGHAKIRICEIILKATFKEDLFLELQANERASLNFLAIFDTNLFNKQCRPLFQTKEKYLENKGEGFG